MKRNNLVTVFVLFVVGVLLAACAQPSAKASKVQPVKIEKIDKVARLTLTTEAAKRLDVQTAPVREDQVIRKRKMGGQVVARPAEPSASTMGTFVSSAASSGAAATGDVLVRVPLGASDMSKVDRSQLALILPIANGDKSPGVTAQPVAALKDASGEEDDAFYYAPAGASHGLRPGQRVLVQVTLVGSGAQRKVIPYAALLYDQNGATWVYTNPAPLVFVRQSITVDYIEGDQAILTDGPAAGTAVVTVGAAELFGAETGIGK